MERATVFALTNLLVEVGSAVAELLSSPRMPISLVLSSLALAVSVIYLVYQIIGHQRNFNPLPAPWVHDPFAFGKFPDTVLFVCVLSRFLVSLINYISPHQSEELIKISVWPLVYTLCMVVCAMFREREVNGTTVFAFINLLVEIGSAVAEQTHPRRMPISLVLSVIPVAISVLFFIYQIYTERRNENIYGKFFYAVLLFCGFCRFIVSLINYSLLSQSKTPIKISAWPLAYAVGMVVTSYMVRVVDDTSMSHTDPKTGKKKHISYNDKETGLNQIQEKRNLEE